MNIISLILPLALLLGGSFLAGFIWMVRQGQYDDLETPAHRVLLEDEN
jgi:cbb3-type cytochrome oxidase maturation protein